MTIIKRYFPLTSITLEFWATAINIYESNAVHFSFRWHVAMGLKTLKVASVGCHVFFTKVGIAAFIRCVCVRLHCLTLPVKGSGWALLVYA